MARLSPVYGSERKELQDDEITCWEEQDTRTALKEGNQEQVMQSKAVVRSMMMASVLSAALAAHGATDQQRLEIVERRLDSLTQSMPVAHTSEKVHLHGYGELHYNTTTQSGKDDKMDFHRMVIGLGYEFTDRILLDVEVDFEHAATEMELEFAHIDFLLSDAVNFRAGSMLMPVGNLNEFHEPTLFYSVERPYVQKYVIPTTWNEGGAGLFGAIGSAINYRLYLVGGLDASGFSGSKGIRGGRGKVAESIANDMAVVGRLEVAPVSGLKAGVSGYIGNAGQDDADLGSTEVRIAEGDLRFRKGIVELGGLIVAVDISDTDALNALNEDVIGEQSLGWYVDGALHVGELFLPAGQDLVVAVRHEQFNTQEDVADGFEADSANDREVTTVGLSYFPTEQVALKVDVESWSNAADDDWTQANLGLGFTY